VSWLKAALRGLQDMSARLPVVLPWGYTFGSSNQEGLRGGAALATRDASLGGGYEFRTGSSTGRGYWSVE
jgi:hypothetical protein